MFRPHKILLNHEYPLLLLNDGQDAEALQLKSILEKLWTRDDITPPIVVGIHAGGLSARVGLPGMTPAANAASAKQASMKDGKSARNYYVLKNKRRSRGAVIPLPIGPSYVYYDYPYYYSRGHYPTHIVRYVYYNPHYAPYRSTDRSSGSLRRPKARAK
ncbi:MAG: hypothetical protein HC869_21385 [Rhodospirillales bacterium]|nr:hypothetical protein [Rhodospirillales bacterium]